MREEITLLSSKESNMTKQQALTELKRTRELNTNMLEPLGISFEAFLRLAQFSKEKRTEAIERLIIAKDSK
tara:strand:+ start:1008 stop:1220 length:213 start_codon:yes stop_codon:yes gene_type:complete